MSPHKKRLCSLKMEIQTMQRVSGPHEEVPAYHLARKEEVQLVFQLITGYRFDVNCIQCRPTKTNSLSRVGKKYTNGIVQR